jgi:hypothetical protein
MPNTVKIVSACVLTLLGPIKASLGVDEQTFRAEAPSSWMELKKSASNLSGSVRFERRQLPEVEPSPLRHSTMTFKYDGSSFVNEMRHYDANTPSDATAASASGRNADYSFRVVESESRPGVWMLNSVGSSNDDRTAKIVEEIGFLRLYKSAWSVLGFDLGEILSNDTIKTTLVKLVPETGLVEIALDSDSPALEMDERITPLSFHGRVMLDPNRNWHVTSYDIKLESMITEGKKRFDLTGRGTVEYGDCNGTELPIRAIQSRNDDNGNGEETVITSSDVVKKRFSPTDFQLSSYGIKEPVDSSNNFRWPAPLIAAAALVLLFICWALQRRTRAA